MKVDVILPTYDGAEFVAAALDSVLAQTHGDWHLTAIDDGSTDETVELLAEFRRHQGKRITLIRNEENMRAAACRMEATRASDGELIAFIDQDDVWTAGKLARQVDILRREPGLAAVHGDVEHIDVGGRLIPGSAAAENGYRLAVGFADLDCQQACRALFERNSIRLVSAVVRRRAFLASGGFRKELFGGEDWEFWVRFAARFRIGHIPEVLARRRIHAGNTSTSKVLERTSGLLQALSLLEHEQPWVADLCAAKRLELEGRMVLESSQAKHYGDAARAAWRALSVAPLRPVTAAYLGIAMSGPIGRQLVALRRRHTNRLRGPVR